MKSFILFAGLSFFTTMGFSQQVSTARNAEVKPVERSAGSQQAVADSVAVLQSMSRNGETVVVPVSTGANQAPVKQEEKPVFQSSARKPD